MASSALSNRYLEGNFAPVSTEATVTDLAVEGTIPDFLDGRYVRNGPNPLEKPDPATYHWFMGTGMVHGVRLGDGRAQWYRNRWVRSAGVATALGETVRPGPVHAGMDMSPNTNVISFAGSTLALVEGGAHPYELSDELDTLRPFDFAGTLGGGYSAHPLVDPATGELHSVSYFWAWGGRVRYQVVGLDGRVRKHVDLDVGGLPMMHAFSLTEHYVVLYDLPVTFDLSRASGAAKRLPAGAARRAAGLVSRHGVPDAVAGSISRRAGAGSDFPYSWDPHRPARVGLLPRDGAAGDLRWYDVGPCYVYHPVNAFEEDGRVVAYVVRHPSTFVSDRHGPFEAMPTLERWSIDPAVSTVKEEQLDDRGLEFPRVDDRRCGRPQRYSYSVGVDAAGVPSGSLLRHDYVGERTTARHFGPGCELSEFVFVPSSAASAEDEGVLIGFVYDRPADRSDLRILDAATLEAVGTVHLQARVPHGFHGNWLPS